MPIIVIAGIAVCVALLARWRAEYVMHRRRVDALQWRVHVNGIRGKSTVTRIIAGMMREAGMTTIAKSTGTFAAVINAEGVDEPIDRRGPPTILEQIEVAEKYIDPGVDALVIECMALKPEYQEVSERMIVRSNIGVLTNVREDHQDVMGETLPEIARSLLSTCPRNGTLITSEQNPEVLEVMREVCADKNTELVVADPDRVTDEENQRFDYISFKENVTIALTIADMVGIPRDIAIDGMVKADPDPGVLRMKELSIDGMHVTWANLFAVNDRESMIAAMEKLEPFKTHDTITVGILNNRSDRERRAIQFADVGVNDLDFDRLVTFGAFEGLVTDRLLENGYPKEHILNLGDEHHPSQDEIIQRMILDQPTTHVLVVGFVNIHTHQAEEMLEYFEHEAAPWDPEADPRPVPARPTEAASPTTPVEEFNERATSPTDALPRRSTSADDRPQPTEPATLPQRSPEPLPQRVTAPDGAPPARLPVRAGDELPRRAAATTPTADRSTTPTSNLPQRTPATPTPPTERHTATPTSNLPQGTPASPAPPAERHTATSTSDLPQRTPATPALPSERLAAAFEALPQRTSAPTTPATGGDAEAGELPRRRSAATLSTSSPDVDGAPALPRRTRSTATTETEAATETDGGEEIVATLPRRGG